MQVIIHLVLLIEQDQLVLLNRPTVHHIHLLLIALRIVLAFNVFKINIMILVLHAVLLQQQSLVHPFLFNNKHMIMVYAMV